MSLNYNVSVSQCSGYAPPGQMAIKINVDKEGTTAPGPWVVAQWISFYADETIQTAQEFLNGNIDFNNTTTTYTDNPDSGPSTSSSIAYINYKDSGIPIYIMVKVCYANFETSYSDATYMFTPPPQPTINSVVRVSATSGYLILDKPNNKNITSYNVVKQYENSSGVVVEVDNVVPTVISSELSHIYLEVSLPENTFVNVATEAIILYNDISTSSEISNTKMFTADILPIEATLTLSEIFSPSNKFVLNWTLPDIYPVTNFTQLLIYQSVNGDSPTLIQTIYQPNITTSYSPTNTNIGDTYSYFVTLYDPDIQYSSEPSNTVTSIFYTKASAPANITLVPQTNNTNQIKLSFNNPENIGVGTGTPLNFYVTLFDSANHRIIELVPIPFSRASNPTYNHTFNVSDYSSSYYTVQIYLKCEVGTQDGIGVQNLDGYTGTASVTNHLTITESFTKNPAIVTLSVKKIIGTGITYNWYISTDDGISFRSIGTSTNENTNITFDVTSAFHLHIGQTYYYYVIPIISGNIICQPSNIVSSIYYGVATAPRNTTLDIISNYASYSFQNPLTLNAGTGEHFMITLSLGSSVVSYTTTDYSSDVETYTGIFNIIPITGNVYTLTVALITRVGTDPSPPGIGIQYIAGEEAIATSYANDVPIILDFQIDEYSQVLTATVNSNNMSGLFTANPNLILRSIDGLNYKHPLDQYFNNPHYVITNPPGYIGITTQFEINLKNVFPDFTTVAGALYASNKAGIRTGYAGNFLNDIPPY